MSLPVTSGKDLVKFLARCGFVARRQRGSHVFLVHPDGRRTSVPLHKELAVYTLRASLIQAGELNRFIGKAD